MRQAATETAFRSLCFENNLASACASLAWAAVNLLCERVVCSAKDIQFPAACCLVPVSVFSPLSFSLSRGFWPQGVENIHTGIDISSDTTAIVPKGEGAHSTAYF